MSRGNQLVNLNLAIHGIDGQLAHDNTLHNDGYKAAFIFADPPFDSSDWDGERPRHSKRWRSAAPPAGYDKLAWVTDIVHHGAASARTGARTTRPIGVV